MLPPSFKEGRIAGDIKQDYGWEARFVFMQMLANVLHLRDAPDSF